MIKRAIFLVVLLVTSISALFGQQLTPIPDDKDVRVGVLDNGMTYYIRHNAKPEKQGEFYILHNVGAIQEDTTQVGLAHFLEHMAFNGTKNFPDNKLSDYLETIGVKFGANLNAFTSQEMTCYNMSSVPLNREGIIDSCLLILHDWSYFITLDGAEIDKERGVIIEELRQGLTANRRVYEALAPTLYNRSRYAYRNVIGNEEGLRTFKHQTLRDFYHTWYRTDQQVLVLVGDFDVDQMEAKVKKVMADIPSVANPVAKTPVSIPGNEKPLVGVATDPELTRTAVNIYIKRDPMPQQFNNTVEFEQVRLMLDVLTDMATYRTREITQKPGAPFINAYIAQGSLTETCEVLMASVQAREGEAAKAFEAIYTELEKIQRYGFTPAELERVKSEKLRGAQQAYDNRNDRRNADFVWTYLNNYRENMPMPDADTQWELDSMLISNLSLTAINQLSKAIMTEQNQVVTISAPEKEGVTNPTREDILAIMAKVNGSEIEAYADNTVKEPLVTATLKGSPVKKTENGQFGTTIWTLGNGARIILKKTDFKADELRMSVKTNGGLSVVSDADYNSASELTTLVALSGVGKFSATELEKQLAGKSASVSPIVNNYQNGFSGSCSPKDLETMLQLLYLYATSPRFAQDDFDVMMDKYESALANMAKNPNYELQKHMLGTMYDNNPRRQILSTEYLAKVDFAAMKRLYATLFDNAAGFNFTFVGNIDLAAAKPLIEKYIGSLPAPKAKMQFKDDKVEVVKGEVTDRFQFAMQVPKTSVLHIFSGDMPYTLENRLTGSILSQILDIRYTQSIREEKGGTYGVSVSYGLQDLPKQRYEMMIYFDTDPKMADELIEIVMDELQQIAANGPKAEDLAKIKEFMTKQRLDDVKKNPVWANYIDQFYLNKADLTTGYEEILSGIDGNKVKALVEKILADKNMIKVIMDPAQ